MQYIYLVVARAGIQCKTIIKQALLDLREHTLCHLLSLDALVILLPSWRVPVHVVATNYITRLIHINVVTQIQVGGLVVILNGRCSKQSLLALALRQTEQSCISTIPTLAA